MRDERREFQRLNLTSVVDGWFGDYYVRILDISSSGARVEADEDLPDEGRALLRFSWRGKEVEMLAEMVHRTDAQLGIHFLEDNQTLRDLLADSARELLEAQEANLFGARSMNIVGDETLTAASAGVRAASFVSWILTPNGWKRRHSLLPDQPPDGFTISASEPAASVELLCLTYQSGDDEARSLTRLLAELSVAKDRATDNEDI